ncbi:acyl carrier protein [Dickeya chrysanthemi]|uniref:acyl carrier protein n=1 Tax=Dickeya chrysanthemi TaxID=556 RepID=UPI001CF24516|nr:acyl carrier protein [Dickeya chrysanthemi]MCA7006948.1 acyl carrier protein [Dickeya chrysanthemi]
MTVNDTLNLKEDSHKEKALAQYLLWLEDILEQPVEPDDNFLDAGGHSMIAISLNEKVKKEFGLTLSMERLYNTTLRNVFFSAK